MYITVILASISLVDCVPVYGGLGDFGYYFADVLIGTPQQRMSAIIDTGSEGLFVTCASCDSCGQVHMDPFYNPDISSSFKVPDQCPVAASHLRNPTCIFEKRFLEGSILRGHLVSDQVAIGTANSRRELGFGCIETESKLFLNQKANGIMGLAPAFGRKNNIHAITLCLSKMGGEFDLVESSIEEPEKSTLLEYRDNHYVVSPSAVSIVSADGSSVHWSVSEPTEVQEQLGQKVLIDSGSTITYLNDALFVRVISLIRKAIRDGLKEDFSGPAICWRHESDFEIELPIIRLSFSRRNSGDNFHIDFSNYVTIEPQKTCLTIASNHKLVRTDLGASWLVDKEVMLSASAGWAKIEEKRCPEHPFSSRKLVEALPGQVLSRSVSTIRWTFLAVMLSFVFFLVIIVRKIFPLSHHPTPSE